MPFTYPRTSHVRRHGPRGYTGQHCHKKYAPWLRDEFAFRCVFCLVRERWFPGQGERGQNAFSVDHLMPKVDFPHLRCTYENLVYSCRACNQAKSNRLGIADPCIVAYADHVRVLDNGTIEPLSDEGRDLIDICLLDRPKLTAARARYLALSRFLASLDQLDGLEAAEADKIRGDVFGYPEDLPDLSQEAPPEGNALPEGIPSSHHARHARGELPGTY